MVLKGQRQTDLEQCSMSSTEIVTDLEQSVPDKYRSRTVQCTADRDLKQYSVSEIVIDLEQYNDVLQVEADLEQYSSDPQPWSPPTPLTQTHKF